MRLPNYMVSSFTEFLLSLELPFRQSRLRSKLVKQARMQLKEIEEIRQELIEKYGEKDSEGKVKTESKEDGSMFIPLKDVDGFNNDITELMQEDWIVEENESNKDMLLAAKDIILNYDGVLKGEEAMQFDVYAEVFENLTYAE
jgi:hypothetical protein